eukprot:3941291-Rhodomonas_salina.2
MLDGLRAEEDGCGNKMQWSAMSFSHQLHASTHTSPETSWTDIEHRREMKDSAKVGRTGTAAAERVHEQLGQLALPVPSEPVVSEVEQRE